MNINFSGNELVSGGEDGLVNIWDARVKSVINKIEPHKNDKIARPELGKWIGAVGFNDDWLVTEKQLLIHLVTNFVIFRFAAVVQDFLCGIFGL